MRVIGAGRSIRYLTILIDLILVNLSFALAYVARYQLEWIEPPSFHIPYSEYLDQQLLLTLLVALIFSQNKVWTRRRGEFWIDEVSRVAYATAAAILLLMAITFFVRPLAFSRLMLVWALIFMVVSLSVARLGRRAILTYRYHRGIGVDRVLLVGSSEVARGVLRTLLARPDLGYQAIGYLHDGTSLNQIGSGRVPLLGTWRQLARVLEEHPNLKTVFIALPGELHDHIVQLVQICHQHNVMAQVVPDLLQLSLSRVEFSNMAGLPILSVREERISPWGQAWKRLFDLALVLFAALPASLLAVIIAIAIKIDSPGPIFYAQERIGQNGRPFWMIKFRSMVVNADDQKQALKEMNDRSGPIFKIKDDPRLTGVGRVIRRLSLDELPQLYNVLVGNMSLVGPRPPLAEEVAEYQPWHCRRLEVKGGITGLWQVSGRADLTFDEQCLLDIYYIENWSLALDLRIILQTVPFSLFGRGAY